MDGAVVELRARPWRTRILLGGLGLGTIAFALAALLLVAWYSWYLQDHWVRPDQPPADPLLIAALMAGLLVFLTVFILPEALWRSHAFVRYLRGRLWLRIGDSGIETGWDGMHFWVSLTGVRLARWGLTGGRGYDTWVLEYRIRGQARRTLVDLTAYGTPAVVAGELAPLLARHAEVGEPAGLIWGTWRAGLRWLLPARHIEKG